MIDAQKHLPFWQVLLVLFFYSFAKSFYYFIYISAVLWVKLPYSFNGFYEGRILVRFARHTQEIIGENAERKANSLLGKSFLTVDRSRGLNAAIHSAFEHGHSEIHSDKNGRTYQFDISRIDSGGSAFGANSPQMFSTN